MRLLLLVVFSLLLAAPVSALQHYQGEQTLWQDTIWSGEVLIDGILTVAPEVTLEIRPGTVVRFTRMDSNRDLIGEHELFIQGVLLARGTAEQPILFTSAESDPAPGDWGAINMMASPDENVLEYCRVEYGYRGFHAHFAVGRLENSIFTNNTRGAQFQESTVVISACRFENNYNGLQFRDSTVTISDCYIAGGYWGMRTVYSQLEMSGCLVENNLINGVNFRDSDVAFTGNTLRNNRRGLYLQRTKGIVVDNQILANSEHGIFLEDSEGVVRRNRIAGNGRAGIRMINSPVVIEANAIVANDEYALINDGDQDVAITGNWWGTVDRSVLAALFRDGRDRAGLGIINLADPAPGPLAK